MRDCTIFVAKTKALISHAVTLQLICAFVLTNAKSRFSHDAAHKFQGQLQIVYDLKKFLK